MLFLIFILPFIGAIMTKLKKSYSIFIASFFTFLELILLFYLSNILFNCQVIKSNLFGIIFFCDDISLLFAIISSIVAFLIFIYSFGYFKEKERIFFSFWALIFLGSMMGVVFSDNLISLYIFWEIAGLCSYRLIGFYREKEHLLKADKAFLITSGGAGIMFLSFAYLYSQTGTFSLSEMVNYPVNQLVFVLFFIGVITKSATFPLHSWLPDVSIAPTPVTAFLHAAVLVKIGIYGLIRIFWKTLYVQGNINWALYLAIISSLIAGVVALIENDFKKILAYSTVSQLGFIISGILCYSQKSTSGVLLFYTAHAFGKGGLFLTAGIMEKIFGTKDIKKMGGIIRSFPFLTIGYLFSMLSVIGFPPFLGFWGKINIIFGFFEKQMLLGAFLMILSSILTFLYLWRTFKYVFMDERKENMLEIEKMSFMSIPVFVLGSLSLLCGLLYLFKGGYLGS